MADTTDLRKEMDKLNADLTGLRTDVADLTRTIREMTGQRLQSTREVMEERARQSADTLRQRGLQARETMEEGIGEHPYASLLAVFGLGFLFGKLMDTRPHR